MKAYFRSPLECFVPLRGCRAAQSERPVPVSGGAVHPANHGVPRRRPQHGCRAGQRGPQCTAVPQDHGRRKVTCLPPPPCAFFYCFFLFLIFLPLRLKVNRNDAELNSPPPQMKALHHADMTSFELLQLSAMELISPNSPTGVCPVSNRSFNYFTNGPNGCTKCCPSCLKVSRPPCENTYSICPINTWVHHSERRRGHRFENNELLRICASFIQTTSHAAKRLFQKTSRQLFLNSSHFSHLMFPLFLSGQM